MTQDEIIEMAKQAHQKLVTEVYVGHMKQLDPWTIELLKIFAKLVAQYEREACLKIAESMSLTDANMNKTWRTGCRDVAEAIRERGQA